MFKSQLEKYRAFQRHVNAVLTVCEKNPDYITDKSKWNIPAKARWTDLKRAGLALRKANAWKFESELDNASLCLVEFVQSIHKSALVRPNTFRVTHEIPSF